MWSSPNGREEGSNDELVGTHEAENAGSGSRDILLPDNSDNANRNSVGPEFKDQVRGDDSIVPINTAVFGETQPSPDCIAPNSNDLQNLQSPTDEGPSFKDQAREVRPTTMLVGPVAVSQNIPPSHILLNNGGPDYKDQARNRPMGDKISQISDFTMCDVDSSTNLANDPTESPVLPVWSARTVDPELVSAHLVAETVAQDQDHPVFLTAEVVDTTKERRRMVIKVSLIILGILIAILVPTFLLTFKDTKSSSDNEEVRSVTPSMVSTNTSAPFPLAPSSSPSISLSPSAAPTMSDRYIPWGEPISTDLGSDQIFMASVSSNGTVVAVANNDTILVYQQNVSSISGDFTWVPLGFAVPVEVEIATFYDKNFTMYLAPDALVLAVGIPSFQNSAGRVDVYDYDRISDRWVSRGEAFIGNSTDQLGYDVALSTDGSIVAMAASNYSSGISHASIYGWNSTTETWQLYGRIEGFSIAPSLSIALADRLDEYQGLRIILGDPNDGIVGKVEVHECTLSDGCSLLDARLEGPDYEDLFGNDVSISRNGDYVAIGSPGILECFDVCANVKVYEYGRGSESVWTLVGQELLGMIGFGEKIKLSQEGFTLAVYFSSSAPFSESSWTQLYRLEIGVWMPVGAPIYAEFLDMSFDGSVVAVRSNGNVVLQALISLHVSNHFG